MSQSKVKQIRKHIVSLKLDGKEENQLYKKMKREAGTRNVLNPVNPKIPKKKHIKESFEDFQKRRKLCNNRRRKREQNAKFS